VPEDDAMQDDTKKAAVWQAEAFDADTIEARMRRGFARRSKPSWKRNWRRPWARRDPRAWVSRDRGIGMGTVSGR
jgi:hypothetical protein